MPIVLQVLSVVLGQAKSTEADGSTSYIGGYNHEAAFSMIIVSFIFVVGLTERSSIKFRTSLFTLAVVLLVLVNYRTSILTILPIAAVFYFTLIEQRLKPSQKAPVLSVVAMVFVFVFLGLSFTMQERFADIGIMLSNLDLIAKAPMYFSDAERDILSARVYIWSGYINAFVNADLLNQIFGFGPDSWKQRFVLYAHNTFVSYLYEYGILGLVNFLFVCLVMIVQPMGLQDKKLSKILIFSFLGFLTMNLATMPLWNIEGLIFFAIFSSLVFGSKRNVMINRLNVKNNQDIDNGRAADVAQK